MNAEKVSSNNADSPWDSFQDTSHDAPQSFEGETGNNSETGEERTFTERDLYPKMKDETDETKDETDEQYEKRLRFMHEKTAEYEKEQAEKEYRASDFGQKEASEQQKLDRLRALQESRVKRLGEEAAHDEKGRELQDKISQSEERITGYRLDYKDSQTVGTPEAQEAYESWLEKHDAENQENLSRRDGNQESSREKTEEILPPSPESAPEPPKSDSTSESLPEPEPEPAPEPLEQLYRTTEQDRQAMIIENEDDMLKRVRTKEYLESDYGKEEQELEDEFDKRVEKLDSLVEKQIITAAERDAMIEKALDEHLRLIDSVRAKFEETKKAELIGRFIDLNKIRLAQMEGKPATSETPEDAEKSRIEAEEKAKLEAEEKAKLETEPKTKEQLLAEKRAEMASIDAEIAENDAEMASIDDEIAENEAAMAGVATEQTRTNERKAAINQKIQEIADIDAELTESVDPELAAIEEELRTLGVSSEEGANTETEPHSEEDNFIQEIRDRFKGIPEKGFSFILSPNTADDGTNNARYSEYQSWWQDQDDTTRRKTAELVNYLKSNEIWNNKTKWGSSFVTWIELAHPEVFK